MSNLLDSRKDKIIASIFAILTLLFILLMAVNTNFFDWTFARHHNVLSWYVRPLFLIPFCYFAYRRSLAGIGITLFLLATSMFWFPVPVATNPMVEEFLQMEKEYLTGSWNLAKMLLSLLVPISLSALAIALWKRNLFYGMCVLVFIAVAKMTWSVAEAGKAGFSIFLPALIGLLICIVILYFGFRRLEKAKK